MEVFAAVGKTVMEVISTGAKNSEVFATVAKTRKYSPQWEILHGICTTEKFVHSTEVFAAVGKTVMEVFAAVGKTVMEVISTGAKTRKYSPQWEILPGICTTEKFVHSTEVFAAVGKTVMEVFAAVGKTVMEVISTGAKTRKYSPQWEILPGICTTEKFVHSTEVFAAVGKTVMEVFAAVGKTVMEVISTGAKTRKYSPQWEILPGICTTEKFVHSTEVFAAVGKNCDGSICRSGKNCDGSNLRSGKNCDGSNLHRGKNSEVFATVAKTRKYSPQWEKL